ncbi:MAG: helix-turn-helix domain-containing protein [Alphaproteobacteria bacterium]|nr:helix-turn-helix domain-containing protein [Alphaproteobacteria bacterium]
MHTVYATTQEAASHLKLSKRYLEDLRRRGDGPKYITFGRIVRYTLGDLDAWAASRKRKSTSESAA